MTHIINQFFTFLSYRPEFGIFSSVFSSLLSLTIDPMTSWIQFTGIIIALFIGIITLMIKIFEFYDIILIKIKARRRRRERRLRGIKKS